MIKPKTVLTSSQLVLCLTSLMFLPLELVNMATVTGKLALIGVVVTVLLCGIYLLGKLERP